MPTKLHSPSTLAVVLVANLSAAFVVGESVTLQSPRASEYGLEKDVCVNVRNGGFSTKWGSQ